MRSEVTARDIEHARTLHALSFWSANRVCADVHTERSREFVEIRAVEESVRQTVHEAKSHVIVGCGQCFIEKNALMVGHGIVRQPVHEQKGWSAFSHVGEWAREFHPVGNSLNRCAYKMRFR